MKGISIDIGVHNFALYIEEFDITSLKTLTFPKAHRYDVNGGATEKFRNEVLNKVYSNGKKILLDRVDLSTVKGNKFHIQTFINLSNYLESNKDHFIDCSFLIIEQQMRNNPMAQRLEQHCVSWFSFMYLDTIEIIVFPSKNKTRVLGAPKKVYDKSGKLKKMTKSQRKKWACDEASKIFTLRNDMETMKHIFVTNKKSDDLSDVSCQLQAFKIKCFIDGQLK